jgi:plastocyanin
MRLITIALLALVLPFASACGGDDGTTTSGGGGGGQQIAVKATDFHFDPPDISVDAGTVTITLTNDGSASHALTIEGNGVNESTDVIGGGDSTSMTVDLAEGTYEIFCPVDGHKDMGMVGTLTVGPESGATTVPGDTPPPSGPGY